MTWFDVIKRGVRLKPEIIKESIKKIVDKKGYFQSMTDREELIENYKDAIKKIMEKHMYRSPEYRELKGHLHGATIKLKGQRPTNMLNNYARKMYKYNLTRKGVEGQRNKKSGLYSFINTGGNIFFKDRNEYEKFLNKFIKKQRGVNIDKWKEYIFKAKSGNDWKLALKALIEDSKALGIPLDIINKLKEIDKNE